MSGKRLRIVAAGAALLALALPAFAQESVGNPPPRVTGWSGGQ
ncbi:MAG: hypothetical protein ABIT16_05455 [Croceibacterium sp.]